jgi:hypothetical protein
MTTAEQFPKWANAEMADDTTDMRDPSPELHAEDLNRPYLIHAQRSHPQRANHHEPTPDFSPHWAQVQLALALLAWLMVAVAVAWMVS